MIRNLPAIWTAAVLLFLSQPICAQQDQKAGVSKRAEMTGVSTNTIHHFELLKDGGLIVAQLKDPQDTQSRDRLRLHMAHMAKMYAEGYFRGPEFIHAQKVPGVAEMRQLKAEIHYQYQDTAAGGQIAITSQNEKAIVAVHKFLRFQIENHQTGDSPK